MLPAWLRGEASRARLASGGQALLPGRGQSLLGDQEYSTNWRGWGSLVSGMMQPVPIRVTLAGPGRESHFSHGETEAWEGQVFVQRLSRSSPWQAPRDLRAPCSPARPSASSVSLPGFEVL